MIVPFSTSFRGRHWLTSCAPAALALDSFGGKSREYQEPRMLETQHFFTRCYKVLCIATKLA